MPLVHHRRSEEELLAEIAKVVQGVGAAGERATTPVQNETRRLGCRRLRDLSACQLTCSLSLPTPPPLLPNPCADRPLPPTRAQVRDDKGGIRPFKRIF